MKYKYIIKEEEIDIATGTGIYGSFIIANKYNYIIANDIPCIVADEIQMNDKNQCERYYGIVNENEFFRDINKYGKRLYSILKHKLNKLYTYRSMFNIKSAQLVSIDDIISNKDVIIPICLEFVNDYGLAINMRDFMNFTNNKGYKILARRYGNAFIPLELLVNQILIYYILHLIFANLKTGYENNETAYKVLSIDDSIITLNTSESNKRIIEILTGFISSRFLPLNESRNYLLKIINASDNSIIPIRYTFNLFTFALERIVNNISTLSFEEHDNIFNETTYFVIRKCERCLSNTVDIRTINNSNKVPTTKKKYCDDCEHKMKLERNRIYEHSLRAMYDELKNNVHNCDPVLANKIRNLKSKDKESKANLVPLYEELKQNLLKKKIEEHKKNDKILN